jgi:hypothetical protein
MQRQQTVVMRGGLDLVTQPIEVPPGRVIAGQNYESEARGYRRATGYERLDGRPKPSEAVYHILHFDSGSTEISEDDALTGDTSGATALAASGAVVTSGTWGDGDAAGYVPIYNLSGTFQDDEGIEVSASNVATVDGAVIQSGAPTDEENSQYLLAAVSKLRANIQALPGAGPVLGIALYKGDIYSWRDNAGQTQAIMYKATSAGWVAQSFGHTLEFTSGTAAFTEGQTLTGRTSGATATVERVIKQSGSWGSTAAGYLVLSGVSGTFGSETITDGAGGSATTSGGQTAITLPPGGKYNSVSHNFYGSSNLRRLYFVNGEGRAHEWDGSVLAPIRTGVAAGMDKPQLVGSHSNHLLLGFAGGAVLNSGTGLPLSFDALDGAAEIGFGEDLTGLKANTKTSTVITGRNKISYLTGTSSADFVLKDISEDSGAVAGTLAVVGEPYFLDDLGVRSLSAAETFGDWNVGTATHLIEPLIRSKRESGVGVVGAMRVRGKNQYRLFYEDGSGISVYFGREEPESMPFQVNFTPSCVYSGEAANGEEILMAGSDDGFVYQIDAGKSWDGEDLEAFLRLSFLHQGAPNTVKRYHGALLDVADGGPETTLTYSSDYSYGNPDTPGGQDASLTIQGGGGFWDTVFWDQFYWDAASQASAQLDLNGLGTNVTIALMSEANHEQPHTITSITINFTVRRTLR